MNIFITAKLEKQLNKLASTNVPNKFQILKNKLHLMTDRNDSLYNLRAVHFKKIKGVGNNNVYAINLGSDRIIAMFLNDYIYRNYYCFQKYCDISLDTLILFSIERHDNQEDAAISLGENRTGPQNLIYVTEKEELEIKNIVNDKQTSFKNDRGEEILTVKQHDCLHQGIQLKLPAILSGIAGSGKTVIAVQAIKEIINKNKENSDGRESIKILYVTFSEGLRSFVGTKIDNTAVDVKTFSDLCINLMREYKNVYLEQNDVIMTSKQFDDFLNSRQKTKYVNFINKNKNLIYSEVCGILKGSMYRDWDRKLNTERTQMLPDIVDKSSYINRNGNKIVEDYKAFDKDERVIMYELAEQYNVWLQNKQKKDINDIAFELHDVIIKNGIYYDYIIADESQDLTEVQIYMLFLLAKNKKILFTGDPNQIINPTFFKIGRLEKIFKDRNLKVDKARLNENFRNSTDVTKLINLINGIRDKELPARSFEERDKEETRNNNDGKIGIIKYSEKNKNMLFNAVKDKGLDVAVIVSTSETKETIKRQYPFINAFTVSEIKGREYPNVITYNILSDYYDVFQNIYKTEWKDKNCEYYFNQFYVAVTRTEHNLYMIEEKEDLKILNDIKGKMAEYLIPYQNMDEIKNISDIYLECGEATGERYYQKAFDFFNNEEFEKAKEHFEKVDGSSKDAAIMAEICKIFSDNAYFGYKEKANLLFKYKKFKLAQKYYEKNGDFEMSSLMYLFLNDYKNFENEILAKKLDLEKMYRDRGFAKEQMEDYLDSKIDRIKEYCLQIKNLTDNITKELTNE